MPAGVSDHIHHIFRWDLDKTYLKTEFDTVRDLVRTARTPAELRENIPGAAALIRAIRGSTPNGGQHQVFFISGSPNQMRGVLERKFAIDGFAPDGFVLKPTVGNFLRGRFRAIRGQVAYKLRELLAGRAEAPIGTQETLFGDDAESDAFIYSLYGDAVAGAVRADELRQVLEKAGAYPDQIAAIEEALESIVHERPIRRIIIHLDQRTPPAAFHAYFPLVVPIYNHLQTAIVLYLDRTLGPGAIRVVAEELLGAYGFDVQRLSNLAEDILRRSRSRYPLGRLGELADELRALRHTEPEPWAAEDTTGGDDPTSSRGPSPARRPDSILDAANQVLEAIADRATYLAGRPLAEEPPRSEARRNYLELLEQERARKEDIKKAKKASPRGTRPSQDMEGAS